MENYFEGKIIRCDFDNNLIAELENGELVYIPFEEVRTYQAPVADFSYMVDQTLKLLPLEGLGECGLPIYSHKAYEIAELDEMKRDLEEKKRNTYWAKLCSITPNGQLAFYRIEGTSLSGAVPLTEFAFNRLSNFHDCIMPTKIQVVVKEFCDNGHIKMSTIPGFWDFEESVQRLNIFPGNEVEGDVVSRVPNTGSCVVRLAPNLSTLVDGAALGSKVRIRIRSVDYETHKVKACLLSDGILDTRIREPFDFSRFVVTAPLPAYVDLEEYRKNNVCAKKLVKESAQDLSASVVLKHEEVEVEEPTFENQAEISPFAMNQYINERTVYDAPGFGSMTSIRYAIQKEELNEDHRLIARLFMKLRFATKYQLRRMAFLMEGKNIDEKRMGKICEKLYKMNILGRLHFRSDGRVNESLGAEVNSISHVYYPGRNYLGFMGARVPHCTVYQTTTDNPGVAKTRLSVNQLLLGMLNQHREESDKWVEASNRIFFEDGNHLTISYLLKMGDEQIYLESVRSNWHDNMLDKLQRYDRYFKSTPHARGVLCLTADDEAEMEVMAEKVEALGLSYKVMLTHDLAVFPTPQFLRVIEPAEMNSSESWAS